MALRWSIVPTKTRGRREGSVAVEKVPQGSQREAGKLAHHQVVGVYSNSVHVLRFGVIRSEMSFSMSTGMGTARTTSHQQGVANSPPERFGLALSPRGVSCFRHTNGVLHPRVRHIIRTKSLVQCGSLFENPGVLR